MFKGHLNFEMKSEQIKDWIYGVVASLNMDKATAQGDYVFRAVYLFASSEKYGNFQVGNLEGLERQMMSTGKDILGGADGYAGRMWRVVNITSGTTGDMSMPASYTVYATKAVYTSPNVKGWQAGIQYVPSDTKGLEPCLST
jgi:hypothetical protein